MSFLISTNRLFGLTQSRRRTILEGKFKVEVLPLPTTSPYRCNLSSDTIRVALDAALAGVTALPVDLEKNREPFIEQHSNKSDVVHQKPAVHAELAMIMAMDKGEIVDVFPYIGLSKLTCIMCSYYISAFNEVTEKEVATKGSHGKAYPGWFWPTLPSHDGVLRPAFLERIRQQLRYDFKYASLQRQSRNWRSGIAPS
jgi:hypothetical protein